MSITEIWLWTIWFLGLKHTMMKNLITQ